MSRERGEPRLGGRERRRSAAVQAAAGRTSARLLSRRDRDRRYQRLMLAAVAAIVLGALLVVGFGAFQELFGFPNQPVAVVQGERVTLRAFTDALADEMRGLQSQVASGARDERNPGAVGSQVERLINAQETLPEDVLEKEIESTVIRVEANRRGITIPPADVDAKINELLSIQRDILNQPTRTPTPTWTPRPTSTPTPEGFVPPPTPEPTPTPDPLTPTATLDPLTPTLTRTPFPTRETATPIVTPTIPATLEPEAFDKAYRDLVSVLRSEANYRRGFELQLLRQRVRDAVSANVPTRGSQAHVLRLATSTRDEARVALIQLGFEFPFEELAAQASERPAEGRLSGDLGWVALGAESPEFDLIVFSADTPRDEWTEPFAVSHHFEVVKVLERRDVGEHDQSNIEKMRDRVFKEWVEAQKTSPEVQRDLSPQERQWAVDRASKGIIETTTDRRRR